jgi:hypothetical protein
VSQVTTVSFSDHWSGTVGAGGTHIDGVVLERTVSNIFSGLVAYYPFDGNAKDKSGNGNDGTVHGATLTSDRFGKPASAYQFDGGSSYIEMARPLPDFPSGSFSVWITAPPAGFVQAIFFEGDTTDGHDFTAHFNSLAFNDGPALLYRTKDPTSSSLSYAFGPRDTNRWFHIVGVADAVRKQREIWIDGALVASGSFTGPANVGYHYKLQVGRMADGKQTGSYFKGKIDDLWIYNRALSAEEIETLRLELRVEPTLEVVGTSTVPALAISFSTINGKSYTLQSAVDLRIWSDAGKVQGNGAGLSISVPQNGAAQFFRVRRD